MAGLDYLKMFSSENTVRMYRGSVRDFLSSVYGKAIENGELERVAEEYFKEGRNYQEDLERYFQRINGNCAPKTRRFKISAVKVFLLENGVELPALFWRRLRGRSKGSEALTLDRPPTIEELRKVLNLMPIQGKALFLVLASSGMRIGEALQLQLSDLDLSADPPRVRIRGAYTKTGNSRYAFISSEAKEAVDQWLKVRPEYLKSASGKSWKYRKEVDDPRVFPFEEPTAQSLWKNALRKAGLEEKDGSTDRMILHPHTLRKFFRSKMGTAIPVDVVEALMGHEGYLTEVYRKHTVEDLAEFYKKGEHTVTVYGNGKDFAKVKAEIEEKSKQLSEGLTTLALKNADLENRLTALIAENTALKERISKLERMLPEMDLAIRLLREAIEEAERGGKGKAG